MNSVYRMWYGSLLGILLGSQTEVLQMQLRGMETFLVKAQRHYMYMVIDK